jgi:hypothetical protein
METVSTSQMSVNFHHTTLHNVPEGSHLHTHRREKINFHETCFTLYLEGVSSILNLKIRRILQIIILLVRFQVLTAASMMFRIVFWDVLIPDDGGSTHL